MDNEFELPIEYNGKEQIFQATLIVQGYTHKFKITVNDVDIFFEPDEQKNYRAVLNYGDDLPEKKIDLELLKTIAGVLEQAFKN